MSVEVMKQALEYLDSPSSKLWPAGTQYNIITALRLAIEQAEKQEPVAWRWKELVNGDFVSDWILTHSDPPPYATESMPLYTAPPQRQPLTEEELEQVFPAIATYHEANKTLYRSIARAIERAHGIGGGV